MMKKVFGKILALALCASSVFSIAACGETGGTSAGNGSGDKIELLVWGSQDDQFMLGEMAEAFKAANPDKKYDIKFGVVGESDTKAKLATDITTGADVFSFPNDQLRDMVTAGMLYEVAEGSTFHTFVTESNMESSVEAVTYENKLYGFPSTADNTFYLFYDKTTYSESDLGSMEAILGKATATNRFFMDLSNGWYLASFFLTAGGTMSVTAEGKQDLIDFDSDAAISAMQVANQVAKDDGFVTGDDAVLTGAFGHDASKGQNIGCAVTGIWNKSALEKAVGGAENLGFMKLPTIKVLGEDKQMISFGGYKAIGINKTCKNPAEAMKFAQFITNYENQVKRYNDRGFAPSNKQAAAHADVLADPSIAALSTQMGYTYPQNSVVSSFWTPAEAVGLELEKKTVEDSKLPDLIADMITKIEA